MSSAEVAEVTAKNKTMRTAAAPDLPNSAAAADGAAKPALTSAGVRVRIAGSPPRATAARPRVVENMNGMANLFSALVSKRKRSLEPNIPCETSKKISLDTTCGTGGDGSLPIGLVLEDSSNWGTKVNSSSYARSTSPLTVSNDVDHTED